MSKIKIITDSGCDISKENEERYNKIIDILPFDIVLGEQSFRERIDITNEEFYKLIDTSTDIPKTSQITVIRFEEKFEQCFNEGCTDLIVVVINSAGSNTYNNAVLASKNVAENIDGLADKMKIHIIDSHCYSLGYGYPLVEAAKKLEVGKSLEIVTAYLEDWFNCLEIYIVGFDLRHMKKSGRISAAAAFLGELMGLKPIISMIEDKTSVVQKARGDKNAVKAAVDYISGRIVPETPWQFLRSTVTEQEDEFIRAFMRSTGREASMISYSGGVVSSNTGPKFFGVLIKGQPRR